MVTKSNKEAIDGHGSFSSISKARSVFGKPCVGFRIVGTIENKVGELTWIPAPRLEATVPEII